MAFRESVILSADCNVFSAFCFTLLEGKVGVGARWGGGQEPGLPPPPPPPPPHYDDDDDDVTVPAVGL